MGDISKHFNREEFACKCSCGFATVDVELLKVLEDIREFFKSPVTINSGCRCKSHNHFVGGESKSKHLEGIASDIVVKGVGPKTIYDYLDHSYKNKYGLGKYNTFTHIDIRSEKARWQG